LIGGEAGGGDAAADGGDVDDVPAALAAQYREHGLGDVDDPEQVGIDLGPKSSRVMSSIETRLA
jgi:hypothetical protein